MRKDSTAHRIRVFLCWVIVSPRLIFAVLRLGAAMAGGHGHGHVNPARMVARCGGPALCSACARERCRVCGSVGAAPHAPDCRNAPGTADG